MGTRAKSVVSLGKDSELVVPTEKNAESGKKSDTTKARFLMLAAAAKLYPESRIKTCFRKIIPGHDMVELLYNPETESGRVSNLVRCTLAACPVCGPWDRLQSGLLWSAALNQRPNTLAMLTLTISHHKAESFADVYKRLSMASAKMWSGRWWNAWRKEYLVSGRLTSLEVTHGKSGFHPHYHILLVSESRWPDDYYSTAWLGLALRWQKMAARVGGFADLEHGCDLKRADVGAVEYLSKLDGADELQNSGWGLVEEATLSDYKIGRRDGRTILQLLSDYVLKNDDEAGRLWVEIERGLKGRSRLKSSKGLWEAIGGPDVADRAESEYLKLSESEIVLMRLSQRAWGIIWDKGLVNEIYTLVQDGDRRSIIAYLSANGVPLI